MADDARVLVSGTWLPYTISEGSKCSLIAEIAKVNKRRRKLWLVLLKAAADDSPFQKAQEQYVRSPSVWLSAMIQAAKYSEFADRETISFYRQKANLAAKSGIFKESVDVFLKWKTGGRHRHYCSFGTLFRAAQILMCDALQPRFSPAEWQFGVKGRGVADAVQQVRGYHQAGFRCVSVQDIKAFYDSFSHQGLAAWSALPVPHKIKIAAAIGRHFNMKKGGTEKKSAQHTALVQNAISSIRTAGLPQGSAFSAMAAAHVISGLQLVPQGGARVINYVDDFLVVAMTESEKASAVFALQALIKAIPVGKFELLEKSSGSFSTGFVYLGHHFYEDLSGQLSVKLCAAGSENFMYQVAKGCGELDAIGIKFGTLASGRQLLVEKATAFAAHMNARCEAYSGADDIKEYKQYFLNVLSSTLEGFAIDPEEILNSALAHKEIGWSGYPMY